VLTWKEHRWELEVWEKIETLKPKKINLKPGAEEGLNKGKHGPDPKRHPCQWGGALGEKPASDKEGRTQMRMNGITARILCRQFAIKRRRTQERQKGRMGTTRDMKRRPLAGNP